MSDVHIDDAAIAELFTDPAGPVAVFIYELTDEVRTLAKASAPVSNRGSAFSPTGALKARIRVTHGHGADGVVQGTVSAPGYPYWFLFNRKGATRNANRLNGTVRHYGYRPATTNFLYGSLRTIFATTTLFETSVL